MKKFITILAFGLIASSAIAQSNQEVQFFVQAGMKAFSSKPFNGNTSLAPSFVPTIGGGGFWQKGHFQVGTDFSYLDGKKDTDAFGSIMSGINANVIGGYRFDLSERMKLSLQSGFAYSLHHLTVTHHTYQGADQMNSTIYHNMVISVPVSVLLQHISPNGITTGLRLGYTFDIGPNEWRYIEGPRTEVYTSATDGFYFQLVFGGLIRLKGAKS